MEERKCKGVFDLARCLEIARWPWVEILFPDSEGVDQIIKFQIYQMGKRRGGKDERPKMSFAK
jgi:hypothetical protein